MARPRSRAAFAANAITRYLHRFRPARLLALLLLPALTLFALPGSVALAAPQLSLPTPPGEHWKIIQGYNCGTHNSWDHFALDLANADGPTMGAPVRAAADGVVFVWVRASGTLILDHGGGFYTQYTHMRDAVDPARGRLFKRGEVLGHAGDRGAPGTPHLHFMAFTASGSGARGRQTVPLSFTEGYDLPAAKSCNAHGGEVLVAGGQIAANAVGVAFHADVAPNRWYNGETAVAFDAPALTRGYSLAWDRDPVGDGPAVTDRLDGSARLADAGEGLHTLFVRTWDREGQQSVVSFGPVGYDATPPAAPPALKGEAEVNAGTPTAISWEPASDGASGVAGYRVYLGGDPNGTDEWFVEAPTATTPALSAGRYLLRVQPLDYAGNAGAWTTLGTVVVR